MLFDVNAAGNNTIEIERYPHSLENETYRLDIPFLLNCIIRNDKLLRGWSQRKCIFQINIKMYFQSTNEKSSISILCVWLKNRERNWKIFIWIWDVRLLNGLQNVTFQWKFYISPLFSKINQFHFPRSRLKRLTFSAWFHETWNLIIWTFCATVLQIDFNPAVNRWQFVLQIKLNKMLLKIFRTNQKKPAPVLMSGGQKQIEIRYIVYANLCTYLIRTFV